MKKLAKFAAALAAAGALSGCIIYDSPERYGYRHDGDRHYRDRDGDGVPNRYDRRPNDPYR